MSRVVRAARPLAVAVIVGVVAAVGGAVAWRAASATTHVRDRGDARFDVLVQRRIERFGDGGAELRPPDGQPQLTAAQAWSAAGMEGFRGRGKPSVRLATFVDPEFPVASGPGNRMVPVAKRALVWVVVADAPSIALGGPAVPRPGMRKPRAARPDACRTSMPVDAVTGASLGIWQVC